MARRATKEEKPYNPVHAALVQSVARKAPDEPVLSDPSPLKDLPLTKPRELPPPTPIELETPVVPPPTREPSPQAAKVVSLPIPDEGEEEEEEAVSADPEPEKSTAPVRRSGSTKRVILSADDQRALEDLAHFLSQDLGTPVKHANIMRACLVLLRRGKSTIRKHAKRAGEIVRPPNENATALAYFEHRLAKLFDLALRDLTPLE